MAAASPEMTEACLNTFLGVMRGADSSMDPSSLLQILEESGACYVRVGDFDAWLSGAAAKPEKPTSKQPTRLMRNATRYSISNEITTIIPKEPTLLDNTLLFLPDKAVSELNIEPNMNDKGDTGKEMWFGRVWQLRGLRAALYTEKLKLTRTDLMPISAERQLEIEKQMSDPRVHKLLTKMAAHWKGAAFRSRCSLSVLEGLKFCNLRGTLVYAHGSGGCSWDNFRICRMIASMGILVVAPDGFAYPKTTAMGQMRHKDILPLHKASDDVDYWANDLLYSSGAEGTATYSTSADSVLDKPDDYRELYEKCYQLRRSELHFIIGRLPTWVKTQGFFLGGTSEGAMTVARFDDQRYGEMVCGRFINSFSIEYCYFTPTPEAGQIGGQLDIPTLNIIGTKDQFFGPEDSVAKLVVMDAETGYGDRNLTGNGYKTMVRQGVDVGLVCVLQDGVHSPCNTHDNFLRMLFNTFFSRTSSIWELHEIWKANPSMRELVELVETTAVDDGTKGINITHLYVPKMKFPNRMSLRQVEALQAIHQQEQIEAAMALESSIIKEEHDQIQANLDRVRQEQAKGHGLDRSKSTAAAKPNYYAKDKVTGVTSAGIAKRRR